MLLGLTVNVAVSPFAIFEVPSSAVPHSSPAVYDTVNEEVSVMTPLALLRSDSFTTLYFAIEPPSVTFTLSDTVFVGLPLSKSVPMSTVDTELFSLSVTDISTSLRLASAVTIRLQSTESAMNSPVVLSNVYILSGIAFPSASVTVTPEKRYSSGSFRANVNLEESPAIAKTFPSITVVSAVLFAITQ